MKDHNIRTRVMEITPAWAERKLAELQRLVEEGIFRNRPINTRLVDSYANDMARGRWGVSHQGIAFDEEDRLIDGQHRLWAVVKAKVPVQMVVTTGLPVETNGGFSIPTMDIIDRGKNRSIGQQLHISHGVAGAAQVAAALRIIAITYTADWRIRLSISQTLELLKMYEVNVQAIFNCTTHMRQRIGMLIGPMAIYRQSFPEKASAFATAFFSKENLHKGSPVLGLIKWIETHPAGSGIAGLMQKLPAVCHAIHEYHHDKSVDAIQSKTEAMYWLGALNKKHGEIIRAMIYPLRKQ